MDSVKENLSPKGEKSNAEVTAAKNEFKALIQFAETGNADAQFMLASVYYEGQEKNGQVVVEHDLNKAIEWFTLSCANGNKQACTRLDECNKEKMARLAKKIAAEAAAKSEMKKNKAKTLAAAAKNEFEALVQFAETGNAYAEYMLGIQYMDGQSIEGEIIVEQDSDSALFWFEKSLKHGNQDASEKLASIKSEKKSRKAKSLAEAAKKEFAELERLAESGDANALYEVGATYYDGKFVEGIEVVAHDVEEAFTWLRRAEEKGSENAAKMLLDCADEIAELQKKKDEESARIKEKERKERLRIKVSAAKNEFEALKQFAETGNSDAQFLLASIFEEGQFIEDVSVVEPNISEAAKWYEKSAAGGHSEAWQRSVKYKVESRLKKLRLSVAAAKRELEALVQFADTGNPDALFFLGMKYYEGQFVECATLVEIDLNKAAECFSGAAGSGHKEAEEMLLICNELISDGWEYV